ncbi:glycoside hydrolase family 13 protein [Actinomadura barringtoniae]|uniref:Glycoside hydrolase family 13 protein n=1 Tax=Actinomadura barringtoniae TaxID=1427535 RepID=A0A939P5P2_9ACTN|nr:glycoside hydrolase family 13 protein [Actinomadura barringtoniae]MBO2445767.1 glycoside hydrolase family 13 protein [Actinomadura barringtoniae]
MSRFPREGTTPHSPRQPQDAPWWRDAVVYEVYVRSFTDSDGDGEGDLQGIRSRLGRLRDLGVDALWLTPFYRSPLADGGYDVADYRDVDPRFGSLNDFDALVAAVHEHGLRLIVDIVPNHTSDQHRWFQEALAAEPGSPARERYIFRSGRESSSSERSAEEEPPTDWPSAFGGSAWKQLPDGEWFLHLYAPEQPDLNWRNPEVRSEFEDILRFWLDRGVDGFRIDVAAGLFKDPEFRDLGDRSRHVVDGPIYSRPEVHEVYRDWRRIIDSYEGERMAIGEVWTDSPEDLALYLRPDELHQAFQFDLQLAKWSASAFRKVITDTLAAIEPTGSAPTWVLSSHDSVRHVTRYEQPAGPPGIGTPPGIGGPSGIGGSPGIGLTRARAALLLLLALPGSAYLYQGEELGLPEVTDIPEAALQDPIWERSGHTKRGRDGCRVPLPWSGKNEPFGFSPGDARPWLPMPEAWRSLTAEAQDEDPASTLSFYKEALAARRKLLPDLPDTLEWLELGDDVVAFRRGPLTCVLNCGNAPVRLPDVRLSDVPPPDVRLPGERRLLLGSAPVEGDLLPANASAWLLG